MPIWVLDIATIDFWDDDLMIDIGMHKILGWWHHMTSIPWFLRRGSFLFFPGAMGRTSDDEWRWLVTPFGVNKLERNGCEDPDTKHIHTYISHTHTHIYIVICAYIYVWYMYIHIFIMRNLYAWFKRSSLWLLSHRYTRFQWQNWRARFF